MGRGISGLFSNTYGARSNDTINEDDIQIFKALGANILNYKVFDYQTQSYYLFVEGTKLNHIQVFAGSGVKTQLKEETQKGLEIQYGGKNWQHVKGFGTLDYNGKDRKAEVHWFQEKSVGKIKFKIKRWIDEN